MTSESLAVSGLQLIQIESRRSEAGLDNFGFESHISKREAARIRTSGTPAIEETNLRKFFVITSGLLHKMKGYMHFRIPRIINFQQTNLLICSFRVSVAKFSV